jgi:hypothetical protein
LPFDGTKLDDVTKLLIEGRERIEQGWCQGRFEAKGSFCMLGAIRYDHQTTKWRRAARKRLARALGLGQEADGNHIPNWNDAPGRTKDEVLQAFDRAIAGE